MTHRAAIALGSNLGDREKLLRSALTSLDKISGVKVMAGSPIFETEPVGPPGQGPYLNAAAVLETELGPRELLEELLRIERLHGRDRTRSERHGPRLLDLDLLLFDDLQCDEDGLSVPHPRMHERRFVLEPLAAIAPDWHHPRIKATVAELLARLASPMVK